MSRNEMSRNEMKTLGQLLKHYRRATQDPKKGGMLTQNRFAEELEVVSEVVFGSTQISYWEIDKWSVSTNGHWVS